MSSLNAAVWFCNRFKQKGRGSIAPTPSGTVTRVERYTHYGEPSDMALDAGPGFTGSFETRSWLVYSSSHGSRAIAH